jgi:hypothetical protein
VWFRTLVNTLRGGGWWWWGIELVSKTPPRNEQTADCTVLRNRRFRGVGGLLSGDPRPKQGGKAAPSQIYVFFFVCNRRAHRVVKNESYVYNVNNWATRGMQLYKSSSATLLTSKAFFGARRWWGVWPPRPVQKLEFREIIFCVNRGAISAYEKDSTECCCELYVGPGVGPRHGTLVPVLLKGKCIVCTYKIIKPQSFVLHYYCFVILILFVRFVISL